MRLDERFSLKTRVVVHQWFPSTSKLLGLLNFLHFVIFSQVALILMNPLFDKMTLFASLFLLISYQFI